MNIGASIKAIRKQLNITQQQLSELTGISQTSLSKIESGTKPSDTSIKKICKSLDIPTSVVYILAMEDTDVPQSKKSKYETLFPIMQNIALEIIGVENKNLLKEISNKD